MKAHPAFEGREIPREVLLGPFRLVWLTPDDVEEDYAAVMESEAELKARFAPATWPEGLTLEANRIDLAWHRREFEANRSFAWIVRDGAGAYLGCAYVYLGWSAEGPMEPWWWFRTSVAGRPELAGFRGRFLTWLGGAPWPEIPVVVDPRL